MNEAAELPVLTAEEARLLGCLIEKEATTPDSYPLTINAAQTAANQKTARDPVMALGEGQVNHALRQLEAKGLARQVFSSRAERYEHRSGAALGLPQPQVVVLGLLLLRGAQTAYELLARSERLFKFDDVEGVRHHLARLMQRTPALVVLIPRGPGQREDRYMHLLSGAVDVGAAAVAVRHSETTSASEQSLSALEARIAALESEVASLRDALAALQDRG